MLLLVTLGLSYILGVMWSALHGGFLWFLMGLVLVAMQQVIVDVSSSSAAVVVGVMGFEVTYSFFFFLTTDMLFVVVGVGCVVVGVVVFGFVYMIFERFLVLFTMEIMSFALAMLGFLCADHVVLVLFFWEWLGLMSFMLIGFWGVRVLTLMASMKGLLMNRFFDCGVVFWCMLMWSAFSSGSLVLLSSSALCNAQQLISFWLVGVVGVKSVMFGLHYWLPDAMEGPTVVSALIHAATLVIAGVVFVAKVCVLWWVGGFMVMNYLVGVVVYSLLGAATYDVKRTIAFSTAWHVGVLCVFFFGVLHVAILHIVAHALFKASLFSIVGSILHSSGSQDVRCFFLGCGTAARLVFMMWCCYCSMGWCCSAVFVTKKVLCDFLWTGWVLQGSLCVCLVVFVGVVGAVLYTMILTTATLLGWSGFWATYDGCMSDLVVLGGFFFIVISIAGSIDGGALLFSSYVATVASCYGCSSLFFFVGWLYVAQLVGVLVFVVVVWWVGFFFFFFSVMWVRSWDSAASRVFVTSVFFFALGGVFFVVNTAVDVVGVFVLQWFTGAFLHVLGRVSVLILFFFFFF
nr:NADH dehydrogenase subunit 5 [Namystynia karyoxenos]